MLLITHTLLVFKYYQYVEMISLQINRLFLFWESVLFKYIALTYNLLSIEQLIFVILLLLLHILIPTLGNFVNLFYNTSHIV